MSDLMLYLVIRGILSLLLIAGGIYSLKKGFQLYLGGIGLAEERFSLSAGENKGKIQISLKRVGTVVMVTAVVWGFLGYLVMPQRIVVETNANSTANGSCENFLTCVPPDYFNKKE